LDIVLFLPRLLVLDEFVEELDKVLTFVRFPLPPHHIRQLVAKNAQERGLEFAFFETLFGAYLLVEAEFVRAFTEGVLEQLNPLELLELLQEFKAERDF